MAWKLSLVLLCCCYYTCSIARVIPRGKQATFYIANDTACMVNGEVYQAGDPVETDDPCETCRCRPPGFACVLRECEVRHGCKAVRREDECCPTYICGCEHNGVTYEDGQEIKDAQNPCYRCFCEGSSIVCSFADCFFRNDCVPAYVPGECCPRYDHCPTPSPPPPSTTAVTTTTTTTPRSSRLPLFTPRPQAPRPLTTKKEVETTLAQDLEEATTPAATAATQPAKTRPPIRRRTMRPVNKFQPPTRGTGRPFRRTRPTTKLEVTTPEPTTPIVVESATQQLTTTDLPSTISSKVDTTSLSDSSTSVSDIPSSTESTPTSLPDSSGIVNTLSSLIASITTTTGLFSGEITTETPLSTSNASESPQEQTSISSQTTPEPTTDGSSESPTSQPTIDEATTSESPTSQSTTHETTTFRSPISQPTADETTVSRSSASQTTTDEIPTSGSPTSQPTTDETTPSETLNSQTTTDETRSSRNPTSQLTTDDTTQSRSPTSQFMTDETTTSRSPFFQPITDETTPSRSQTSPPTTDETTSQSPTSQPTTDETPTSGNPTPQSTTDETTTFQSPTSQSTTDETTTSQSPTSQSTTDETTTSQSPTSQSTTDETTTSGSPTSQPTTPGLTTLLATTESNLGETMTRQQVTDSTAAELISSPLISNTTERDQLKSIETIKAPEITSTIGLPNREEPTTALPTTVESTTPALTEPIDEPTTTSVPSAETTSVLGTNEVEVSAVGKDTENTIGESLPERDQKTPSTKLESLVEITQADEVHEQTVTSGNPEVEKVTNDLTTLQMKESTSIDEETTVAAITTSKQTALPSTLPNALVDQPAINTQPETTPTPAVEVTTLLPSTSVPHIEEESISKEIGIAKPTTSLPSSDPATTEVTPTGDSSESLDTQEEVQVPLEKKNRANISIDEDELLIADSPQSGVDNVLAEGATANESTIDTEREVGTNVSSVQDGDTQSGEMATTAEEPTSEEQNLTNAQLPKSDPTPVTTFVLPDLSRTTRAELENNLREVSTQLTNLVNTFLAIVQHSQTTEPEPDPHKNCTTDADTDDPTTPPPQDTATRAKTTMKSFTKWDPKRIPTTNSIPQPNKTPSLQKHGEPLELSQSEESIVNVPLEDSSRADDAEDVVVPVLVERLTAAELGDIAPTPHPKTLETHNPSVRS